MLRRAVHVRDAASLRLPRHSIAPIDRHGDSPHSGRRTEIVAKLFVISRLKAAPNANGSSIREQERTAFAAHGTDVVHAGANIVRPPRRQIGCTMAPTPR